MQPAYFFFWVFSIVLIVSALAVILARNPVHSVLFLILSFVCAAGLFLLMGAEFLAMILIVVYVGAVAVLFLFVVMMLDVDFAELRQGFLQYLPIGGIIAFFVAVELGYRRRTRLDAFAGNRRAASRRPRRHGIQHRGARPCALYAVFLLLPGGGPDPVDRDDRRDRADFTPQSGRQAAEHRRSGRAHAGRRGRASKKALPGGRVTWDLFEPSAGLTPQRTSARGFGRKPMTPSLTHFLVVAAILFTIGVSGIILNRKNIIIVLMSVELILLSVNINLVAFSTTFDDLTGQVFALFVLTVAAAEAAIGLAILVAYYRNRGSIAVEDINALKG